MAQLCWAVEIKVVVHLYFAICHKTLSFLLDTELSTCYPLFWLLSGGINEMVSVVK